MFYEGVRFIQIFEQNSSRSKGTVFTKVKIVLLHLSFNKCYFDNKTIKFGHCSWNELIKKKWIGTPFEFDKKCKFTIKFSLFS